MLQRGTHLQYIVYMLYSIIIISMYGIACLLYSIYMRHAI